MRATSCWRRLSSCKCLLDVCAFSDKRQLLSTAQSTTSRNATPYPGSSGECVAASGRDERAGRDESNPDDYHAGRDGTGSLTQTSHHLPAPPPTRPTKPPPPHLTPFVSPFH